MALPPLHKAARNDDVASIKSLIASGVDVDVRDAAFGCTALYWAASLCNLAAAVALIDAGADVNALNRGGHLSRGSGNTPLHAAALHGQTHIARRLIAAGADVNRIGDYNKSAARIVFIYSPANLSMLKLLLRSGATLDFTEGIVRLPRNKAAFALLDSVVAAGGWDDFVLRHRAIIKSIVSKCAPLPDDCLLAIAAFVFPPGGW